MHEFERHLFIVDKVFMHFLCFICREQEGKLAALRSSEWITKCWFSHSNNVILVMPHFYFRFLEEKHRFASIYQ